MNPESSEHRLDYCIIHGVILTLFCFPLFWNVQSLINLRRIMRQHQEQPPYLAQDPDLNLKQR
jgi:hypothetical protein